MNTNDEGRIFFENGWFLNYLLPKDGGGLVLRNVQHDGYHLANDIRVVRVWIGSDDPRTSPEAKPKEYLLGSEKFPCLSGPNELSKPNAPVDFPFYQPAAGLNSLFDTKEPIFGDGTEKLAVIQEYLFTSYGKDPPHEPGHVLDAARLFPLLHFVYLPGKLENEAITPKYLRADYRLHLSLDKFLDKEKNLTRADNHAGIFRDNENLPPPIVTYFVVPGVHSAHIPHLEDIFAAGEKPLQFEVIGPGLTDGWPMYPPEN